MKAELSIWSQYYYEMSPEDAVEEFLKHGIRACELSDEHGRELLERGEDVVATGKAFASFLRERSFSVPQGHLWLKIKLCSDPTALEILFRWIDLYEAIGIRNMVLHCDTSLPEEWGFETRAAQNIEKLKALAAYIEGRDITVCLENLRMFTKSAEELLYIIDRVGSKQLGICLDTGHLNLTVRDQRAFILSAGKRLRALHIADNEGERDQHMMPFTRGTVDFVSVVRALREVDYEGLFNLEIPGESHIPLELRGAKIRYIQSCYDYLMRC
ncbi:MAG: sugar phosphate isomerase/epimerase [Clostridia bacterium]|nr:sugar phosphate isomerase/epimerase [Clostridia bacterium]